METALEGLQITSGATIALANLLNLTSISTMGSAGFLIIFAIVNAAEARTSGERGSAPWISSVAAIACVAALVALLVRSTVGASSVFAGMVALAFSVEAVFRRVTGVAAQA